MKLIPNWRSSWKFSSIQLLSFALICDVVATLAYIIDEKFPVDPLIYVLFRLAMTVFSMVARLVAQSTE